MKFDFSSDTTAPAMPQIIDKFKEINEGAMPGYSDDPYTEQVRKIMQGYFSKPVSIFFNTSGSGANVLAIKAMKDNYSSIICCDCAHINTSEVGGTEFNTGCKIVACQSSDAKLTVDMIKSKLTKKTSINASLPKIVVVSQATEYGTVYTPKELKEICDFCHENELYVYVDGARLANAMAYLNVGFKEMLEDTGVDIASFGGNKNGAMFGEMIIVLNQKFAKNFILNQKQSMQLFSKTRYLSSQFLVMLEDELWRKNASHANNLALYLANKLEEMGFKITFPVQSNHVFVQLTDDQAQYLKQEYKMATYEFEGSTYRLMTSWCMKKEDVDELLLYLKNFKPNNPLFKA